MVTLSSCGYCLGTWGGPAPESRFASLGGGGLGKQFGKLDIFVSNDRFAGQGLRDRGREASGLMPEGGRIVAITYASAQRAG